MEQKIIKCPKDLNQFVIGEPIFENTFPEEKCEKRKFYGDCETLEQRSTTKNDLRVGEFQEIVVAYPPEDICIYPEYKGKPYFSIKYKKGNDYIVGYGTYNPEVFSRYLKDYFMSSVTSQRTGHWILRNSFLVPYKCSECNYESERYDNFCPNCGAKMDLDKDE